MNAEAPAAPSSGQAQAPKCGEKPDTLRPDMTLAALQAAIHSADDVAKSAAVDDALDDLKADAMAAIEGIDLVLQTLQSNGAPEHDVTSWNYRLVNALESAVEAAIAGGPPSAVEGSAAALRAASLLRDTLNDGEGTTRTLVAALMLGADDDDALKAASAHAGGPGPAIAMLEKAAKRAKGDDERQGRLRRALARTFELIVNDKERAFFESLKAARKRPGDGLYVDDVYRLASDIGRLDEGAAFFQSLGDDPAIAPRARATAFNKLGALKEAAGDDQGAFSAYVHGLFHHETKAARKKAQRLKEKLGLDDDLPEPVVSEPDVSAPVSKAPGATGDDDTAAFPSRSAAVAEPSADTVMRQERPAMADVADDVGAESGADSGGFGVGDNPTDIAVAALDIVSEEDAAPPPPVDDGLDLAPAPHALHALHAENDVPADGLIVDDGENSVLMERGDATVERPPEAPTMTMPPTAPPSSDDVVADSADSADVAIAQPRWAAPPPLEVTGPSMAMPSSAVDDGPLPPPTAPPLAVSPAHAGFAVGDDFDAAFDDDHADDGIEVSAFSTSSQRPAAGDGGRSPLSMEEPIAAPPVFVRPAGLASAMSAPPAPASTPPSPPVDVEPSPPSAEAPSAEAPSTAPPSSETSSETSSEASASGPAPTSPASSGKKKKRGKKARRGHGTVDNVETTTPGGLSASMLDHTVPAGDVELSSSQQPSLESSLESSRPVPGDSFEGDLLPDPAVSALVAAATLDEANDARVEAKGTERDHPSLGDELPEPAVTAPGADAPKVDLRDEPVVESPRDIILARAQELLAKRGGGAERVDDDVADFLGCAEELSAIIPGDPRVLRLAAKGLLLAAADGELPTSGWDLVVAEAPRHGDRATALIREIQLALPPERRADYSALWLAGARAAGHDVDATHALLEEVAAADGPDGPLFTLLDAILKDAGDVDRRDVLHLRAWRSAEKAGDATRQVQLLERRIDLLELAKRDGPALQAWTQLALEHPTDEGTRAQARRFVEQKATPDERARFLARLARKLEGAEAESVLRELLAVRAAVDDRVGAEATARDLLSRVPGDARASSVLAEILADDPRRVEELVEVLRVQIDSARAAADTEGAKDALERLARAYTSLERPADAASALVEAVRLAPGDNALVQRVTEALLANDRVEEATDLLDELAEDAPLSVAGRLWLRAAELTKGRLKRLGRARELLEKAIAADDKNAAALNAHAELLLEVGDANGAMSTLERLVHLEPEGKARSKVHVRLAKLLEEHLQRDDDAIKRYRAALDGDRSMLGAWEGLYGVARRRGLRDVVVEALTGIAGLETGRARANTLVKLGRLYDQELNDKVAAATAFESALGADAADTDALQGLLSVRSRALQGEGDLEAALAVPSPELVDEVTHFIAAAEGAGATLPFALRRLLALGVTQRGDTDDARVRFEALLEERGDDLPTLLAFARHLAHAAQRPLSPGIAAAADDRRREVLEAVLLHHAYALKPVVHVDVWGEVCALRLQQGDIGGAKKAAKKALSLLSAGDGASDLEAALSDRAVRAFVLSLEDGLSLEGRPAVGAVEAADVELLESALRLDLGRAIAPSEKARLKEKQARIAVGVRNDVASARQLLAEALKHDPDLSSARELLFDLELSGEEPRVVLEKSRALLQHERDPQQKALLHLKLFRLQQKMRSSSPSSYAVDAAAADIRAAVELSPKNVEILETAEKFFNDAHDAKGLDDLFTARLKYLDRNDVAGRTALLERLAQLRRYDLRDLRGAIDACEAISALDPDAIKPREDAARMHDELGQWKLAVAAWRSVLDRDTLMLDAWRGLFSVLARSRQGDEAFATASSMVALEIADDDMARAVRAVRPPFPRWPIPPADLSTMKKRLSHPLERTCVRAVLELVAPRLLPRLGRPLEDFGVRRRDAIAESKLPASVAMAVRTAAGLAGFRQPIPLYALELGTTDGASPPFAALPAREPGLIVTQEVVRGGMTPERAFALGRAVAWLSPWAILAASLDAADIRRMLESLVSAFLTQRDMERPNAELERSGAELKAELLHGLGPTDTDAFELALLPALRDWVVARSRLHLVDWKAGVGYSGDRLGFLLAGDLPAAVKVIRSAGASTMAMRLAIKELVLFSVSQPYLQLRRELSLALPEPALAPVLDLG